MGGGSKYSLCGARAARRYLILVNMVTAIAGLLFIVIGAISLVHGEGIKKAVDEYCLVECGRAGCAALECSGRLPSCDCSRGQTQLPGYFYAPASGLIAVGVFSLITPLLGCIAAIRHQAAMLCLYIIAASFVLILQFSFGVAAAAVASMDRVPERMQLVFNDQYRDFDWKYLKVMRVLSVCGLVCVTHTHTHTQDFLPPACYAAHTTQAVTYGEKTVDVQTSHPACSWNHTCTDAAVAGVRGYCCDAAGKCATSVDKKELCASTHTYVYACVHAQYKCMSIQGETYTHAYMHTCIHAYVHTCRACIHTSHMYLLGARYTMGALHTYSLRVSTGALGAFCGVWRSLWRSRHC